jgi:hypothetical protein
MFNKEQPKQICRAATGKGIGVVTGNADEKCAMADLSKVANKLKESRPSERASSQLTDVTPREIYLSKLEVQQLLVHVNGVYQAGVQMQLLLTHCYHQGDTNFRSSFCQIYLKCLNLCSL